MAMNWCHGNDYLVLLVIKMFTGHIILDYGKADFAISIKDNLYFRVGNYKSYGITGRKL